MIASIYNAKQLTQKLKATIQRSGKLGFTAETIELLKLSNEVSIRIASDDKRKDILYMAVVPRTCEDAFPVIKTGIYYYLNTKQLFDEIRMDYIKFNIIFDLTRCFEADEAIGGECYKMTARPIQREQKNTNDNNESNDNNDNNENSTDNNTL